MKARNIKIQEHIAYGFERQNIKFELSYRPLIRAFKHHSLA